MRVIIADDSTLFREGLVSLLEAVEIEVVAQAADGDELLRLLEAVAGDLPDVAIMDMRMPPTHTDEGLLAAERIRSAYPGIGVLVLSTYADTPLAVRLLEHGSSGIGYLLKDRVSTVAALKDALARLAAGESMIDRMIVDDLLRVGHRRSPVQELSEREQDVLRAMAEGRTNSGIATQLFLSDRTVENYVARIFGKLELPTTADSNRRVLAVLEWLRNSEGDREVK
jgi:DNA-binding NarL/FixJ family response regulator